MRQTARSPPAKAAGAREQCRNARRIQLAAALFKAAWASLLFSAVNVNRIRPKPQSLPVWFFDVYHRLSSAVSRARVPRARG